MKNLTILILILYSVLTIIVHASEDIQKDVGTVLRDLVDSNHLIGTHFVAVVNENGLLFTEHQSNRPRPLNNDIQFLVASHTKAMTSTLLATLHENKEINLFKSGNQYKRSILINKRLQAKSITLDQLLTHTAGFTSVQHTFKTAFLGYENKNELVESLNYNTLVAPDFQFRYSNTGPIVASMIVEAELDKSWGELMKSHLFMPLGMTSTSTKINSDILPSIVTGKDGKIFRQGHYKTNKTMHASGGVVSTINDLSLWLKANINQDSKAFGGNNVFEYLHKKQVEQDNTYFTYQRSGYSLGWDIANYNGEVLLTRFGNYAGYSIHVSFMPKQKLGVIAFTNQDIAYVLPHVIANYAYNSITGKSNKLSLLQQESKRLEQSIRKSLSAAPDVSQILTSSNLPSNIIGAYENENKWPVMNIFLENDQAKVSWGELIGLLLKVDGKYKAHLGSLQRPLTIKIENDGKIGLKNGSLPYTKI
ncbi:serine hydrolase domain-containing protein [Alteromonas lipotrueiana]|uniref:serine hydrolase domain-containing protein n=1 Tax=Alteromonas lipotrueiana TaxID=2803815 RepID=UPI001C441033|nr:serine hydrolase domain-containing protein [Alteromonas lipotrueiana]